MKIAIVRGNCNNKDQKNDRRENVNLRSGFENIAHALDGYYWGTHVAAKEEFDCVLLLGSPVVLKWLIENGKPKGWKKIVYVQYIGMWEINNIEQIERIIKCNFDGFLVPNYKTGGMFDLFKKPVCKITTPYYLKNDNSLRSISKEEKLVCIDIKHCSDVKINFMNTLRVMQKLKDFKAIVSTNPSYRRDTPILRRLVDIFGLTNIKVKEHKSRPEYLKDVARCKVFLSMDFRNTMGRFCIDAASLGSYCVGSYSSMMQLFFPESIIDPVDIDRAAALVYNFSKENKRFEITDKQKIEISFPFFKKKITEFASSL